MISSAVRIPTNFWHVSDVDKEMQNAFPTTGLHRFDGVTAFFRCILFALFYSTGTCSSRIVEWGNAIRSTEAMQKIHMANSSACKRRRLWENR